MEKPKKVMKKPKASSSKPGKASKLSKASLEKLGQMSLKDKMKAAAEGAENPDEAAIGSMPKLEKSKAWGKHQTALMHGPKEEQAAYNDMSKKDKGIAAAASLLEKESNPS